MRHAGRAVGPSRAVTGLALVWGLLLSVSCVDTSSAQSRWSGWTHLRMKAHAGALVTGTVDMRLTQTADDRLFETETVARLLGAKIAQSRTETRIDPATGRVERYISRSKKRARRYEFGEDACVVERLVPPRDPATPIERWEVTSSERFAYPHDESGEAVRVFDYYGMLLHLRETDLREVGDAVTLFVATSRGIAPYRIAVEEARSVERKYRDLATGDEQRVRLRELRLGVRPADPEADEGILNMQGEIELWVESESKTLLSIRGKAPKVPGRIEIELAGMS